MRHCTVQLLYYSMFHVTHCTQPSSTTHHPFTFPTWASTETSHQPRSTPATPDNNIIMHNHHLIIWSLLVRWNQHIFRRWPPVLTIMGWSVVTGLCQGLVWSNKNPAHRSLNQSWLLQYCVAQLNSSVNHPHCSWSWFQWKSSWAHWLLTTLSTLQIAEHNRIPFHS